MIELKGSTRFLGSLCFVILYHLVHIQLDFKHRCILLHAKNAGKNQLYFITIRIFNVP